MLYSLHHYSKLIGLFNSLEKCRDTANGLISNNFADSKDLLIREYKHNSLFRTKDIHLDLEFSDDEYEPDSDSETSDGDLQIEDEEEDDEEEDEEEEEEDEEEKLDEEELKKLAEISKRLNILKKEKERMENSKNTYDVDIKLYERFKKELKENENFEIPEMFREKYKIMDKLFNENNLTWQTFVENYDPQFSDNSYMNLFDDQNDNCLTKKENTKVSEVII